MCKSAAICASTSASVSTFGRLSWAVAIEKTKWKITTLADNQSINLEKSVGDMLALELSPSMWSVWSGDWSNYQVLTSVHNSHRFGSSLRIHLSRLLYPKRGQSVKRHKRHASFKTMISKFTSLEEIVSAKPGPYYSPQKKIKVTIQEFPL